MKKPIKTKIFYFKKKIHSKLFFRNYHQTLSFTGDSFYGVKYAKPFKGESIKINKFCNTN